MKETKSCSKEDAKLMLCNNNYNNNNVEMYVTSGYTVYTQWK